MKKSQISFSGANPMQLIEELTLSEDAKELPEEVRQVGNTIKAYLKAAEQLLAGKYQHLQSLIPSYLLNPGNILVASCTDGIVIRYETKVESHKLYIAVADDEFANCAYTYSQNLIRCHSNQDSLEKIGPAGIELEFFVSSSANITTPPVAKLSICFDVIYSHLENNIQPPQKPFCLLSVLNIFELGLEGEMINAEATTQGSGQRFLTRSKIRLPVGWDCIEVYPNIDINQWKPEYAPIWAENDILAAALTAQLNESSYQSLDPKAEARRQYAKLLNEFKALLDSNPEREQMLQTFLQTHPELLCPTHTKMWPKLDLGAKETDFVFCDANQDYLLVELERSTHKLFRKDGHLTAEVSHAQGQITDWKRYLEDNLATVQRELGLVGVSANPNALIVIGRSITLTKENRRKLISIQNEHPKTKILTYDDVYENAKAVVENLLGPILEVGGNTQVYYPRG